MVTASQLASCDGQLDTYLQQKNDDNRGAPRRYDIRGDQG